ncbi:MAG TPA: hypothetical protein VKD72_06700 [Gemmataceae bacterium]|nr:hypothetical protein [Gemmataceae bacterium]
MLHESTLDRLTFPGVFLLVAAFAFLQPTPSFLTHLLAAPGYTHAEPLALRRADRRAALPQLFRRRAGRATRASGGVGLLPRCLGVRPRPLPRPPTFAGSYVLTSTSGITGSGSVVFSAGTSTVGGTISASGGVTIQSGAAITGAATITANVTNSGTIHVGGGPGVAGRLTINGNFTQTSTGALNVELGGLTAGSQFDQLVVSGSASLAGTLNVSRLNGFTPSTGDSFQAITFGSRSGTFSTITGLQQGGTQLTPQYNSTNFTLVASAFDLLGEDEEQPERQRGNEARDVVATARSAEADRPTPTDGSVWEALAARTVLSSLSVRPEDAFFIGLANAAPQLNAELLSSLDGEEASAPDGLGEFLALLFNLLFGWL